MSFLVWTALPHHKSDFKLGDYILAARLPARLDWAIWKPWEVSWEERRIHADQSTPPVGKMVRRVVIALVGGLVTFALAVAAKIPWIFDYEWVFIAGTIITAVLAGCYDWVHSFATARSAILSTRLQQAAPHLVAPEERDLRLFVEEDVWGFFRAVQGDGEGIVSHGLVLILIVTNQEDQTVTLDITVDLRLKMQTPAGEPYITLGAMWNDGILGMGGLHCGLLKIPAHETEQFQVPLALTAFNHTLMRGFDNLADGDIPHIVRFHDRNTGLITRCPLRVSAPDATPSGPHT